MIITTESQNLRTASKDNRGLFALLHIRPEGLLEQPTRAPKAGIVWKASTQKL